MRQVTGMGPDAKRNDIAAQGHRPPTGASGRDQFSPMSLCLPP